MGVPLKPDHDLHGFALIHRSVARWNALEIDGEIELFAAMGHTDVADASSWTGDSNGCIHRLLRADALHHRFCSPSRQLDHFPLGLFAATRDEVGCAETAAQFQALRLMPQQDDALRSQASCCQHPT